MYKSPPIVYIYPVIVTVTQESMTDIRSTIIQYQGDVMSDMATIIGRYKGSMGVFAERVRELMQYEDCYNTKLMLEQLAESMTRIVAENEQL